MIAALERCGGNQSAAALALGITRRALTYRMANHGIDIKAIKAAAGGQ
jgi:DNA-binding NtrC family response regulator